MSRRTLCWISALCLSAAGVAGWSGCDYESSAPPPTPSGSFSKGIDPSPISAREREGMTGRPVMVEGDGEQRNKIILDSVVTLMENAVLKPGGQNFDLATRHLNEYFLNPNPVDYALGADARTFLTNSLPDVVMSQRRQQREEVIKDFERTRFELVDARHIEDCMLYSRIARRVAGSGDDLTRVGRLFDWTVQQVQLVPAGRLAGRRGFQAQARPFDVLMRGMATEDGATWAERAWVFLSLCRQLDLDCGMVAYTPTPDPKAADAKEPEKDKEKEKPAPRPWICVVLIEGKPYLYDARIGQPIAGPDGTGVATLQEALNDPRVLSRLELPGQSAYGTTRAQLLASPSKIGVQLDSSPGYFSPRMRLLQRELSGTDRTVLYRDPIEADRKFAEAFGPSFGGTGLWELPIMVNTLLFTSGDFTGAAQEALALFDPMLPLVYARVRQLRGETSDAITRYVDMRFAERPLLMDKKTPMPPEVQRAMDVHATYYLGLCKLEEHNLKDAERFFRETLKLLPEPGRGQLYYNMFRWGAQTNLARLLEQRGDADAATAYYSQPIPTAQYHGNLLKARDLVWRNPTGSLPAPVPPAPTPEVKNMLLRDAAQ